MRVCISEWHTSHYNFPIVQCIAMNQESTQNIPKSSIFVIFAPQTRMLGQNPKYRRKQIWDDDDNIAHLHLQISTPTHHPYHWKQNHQFINRHTMVIRINIVNVHAKFFLPDSVFTVENVIYIPSSWISGVMELLSMRHSVSWPTCATLVHSHHASLIVLAPWCSILTPAWFISIRLRRVISLQGREQ